MNDLTKEELQRIFYFIEQHKQDSYDDMKFSTIMNKIQFMIDNYPTYDCQQSIDD